MRQTNQSRRRSPWRLLPMSPVAWLLIAGLMSVGLVHLGPLPRAAGQEADPILARLPGVDRARVAASGKIWSDPPPRNAVEESAKLLWSLSRIDPAVLEGLASAESPDPEPIQVVRVRGRVVRYDAVRLPEELAEVLEFDRIYRVEIRVAAAPSGSDEAATMRVVARQIPTAWMPAAGAAAARFAVAGQPVELTAVQTGHGSSAILFAERLRWHPESGAAAARLPEGWRMLAAAGVDVAALSGVAARNRQPLMAEDREAFYATLAAAARLPAAGEPPVADEPPVPPPTRIDTAAMLQHPAAWVGHWVRLDVDTARLTRVAVTSPELRSQLGRDSYWQIDAFGDLGGSRVQLEPPGRGGEPLVFENRFPVSLAILELPDWLWQRVAQEPTMQRGEIGADGPIALVMIAEPVTVDGFFFRLWSYDSEFAESRGGRQISPLLLVAELHPRTSSAVPQRSVAAIGWIFAAIVIGGMAIAALVLWRIGRRDRAIARARRAAAAASPPPHPGPW